MIPGTIAYGSPLDDTDFITPILDFTAAGVVWNGIDPASGNLTIELNSGDNGNNWAQISVLGSVGLTALGSVNRDGVGAVVGLMPEFQGPGGPWTDGDRVLRPVVAGGSFASQHSLEASFGLGTAKRARVDVLWPGGVRNRLYKVKSSERILFPEIPCTIDPNAWDADQDGNTTEDFPAYIACVTGALVELVGAGVILQNEAARLGNSAATAFFDP